MPTIINDLFAVFYVHGWANHKSNDKYKSQIICKNDLNQNLK